MRAYRFTQVDVFAEGPLRGNPLAVFPDAEGLDADEMQAIAGEMNLSETTFVTVPRSGGDARVRIFTPVSELPFAGHPSVGTACELVRLGLVPASGPTTPVVLELGVGPTVVDVEVRDGVPVAGTVHQGPPRVVRAVPAEPAAEVLGLAAGEVGVTVEVAGGSVPVAAAVVGTGLEYAVIPVADIDALARVRLAIDRLSVFEEEYGQVYAFAFTGDDDPWVEARGLFPLEGIPEDPATGSAAGPLAAHLALAGLLAPGETRVVLQGRHVGRPSRLAVSVAGECPRFTDVLVGGGVSLVIEGELRL